MKMLSGNTDANAVPWSKGLNTQWASIWGVNVAVKAVFLQVIFMTAPQPQLGGICETKLFRNGLWFVFTK